MADAPPPGIAEIARVFGRIGVLSFGGPAAQIALMHRELVEDRPWLSERQFLSALSFCMLLPGPEAMQLATYAGWRLRGVAGGLIAGGLFVAPGALVIFALALLYARFGGVPEVEALFLGIKATVIVIVVEALLRLGRRALTGPLAWALALAAFLAIFAFALPFPLILAAGAAIGAALLVVPEAEAGVPPPAVPLSATLARVMVWGALWLLPLLALWLAAPEGLLAQVAIFFSWLAVVTFGGAYAVLAYMVQEVVTGFGWLTTGQMMDALGLAETTPGPLILVTQFVAVLAGAEEGGAGFGLAAGAVALWATFMPCFLWIFAGAPHVEWITAQPRLRAGLSGITAVVVGVILNLSVWFALNLVFGEVAREDAGLLSLWLPELASVSPGALALTALAAWLLVGRGMDLLKLLPVMALAGLGLHLAGSALLS